MTNYVVLPIVCVLCGLAWVTRSREDARGRAIGLAWLIVSIFGAVDSGYWQGAYIGAGAVLLLGILHGEPRERIATTVTAWTTVFWIYLTVSASLYAETYSIRRPAVEVPVLILVAASMAKCRAGDLRQIWLGLLVTAYVQVAWGLRDLKSTTGVWGYPSGENLLPGMSAFHRVPGSLNHPIVYAVVITTGLILVVANPLKWPKAPRLISGILFIGALYASGSRSAIIAAAVAIVIYLIHAVNLTHWVRNVTFIGIVAFATSVVFGHQISQAIEKLTSSTSYTQRQSSLQGFNRLLHREGAEQWFGVGFGGQQKLYVHDYLYSTNNSVTVDNMLVYVLGTMGLIGFILFAAYCLWMLYRADRLGRALLSGIFVMFFSFDVLTWPSQAFLMTLVMGAGVMGRQVTMRQRAAPEASRGVQQTEPAERLRTAAV